MKYLGVDFGSKKVGLAHASDADGIAFPRQVLINDEKLLPTLKNLLHEEKIDVVVMGDTLSHGGGINPVTPLADSFAQSCKSLGFKVVRVPEMWSSIEASRYAPKGREHDDAAAAAVILQRYLDMQGKGRDS